MQILYSKICFWPCRFSLFKHIIFFYNTTVFGFTAHKKCFIGLPDISRCSISNWKYIPSNVLLKIKFLFWNAVIYLTDNTFTLFTANPNVGKPLMGKPYPLRQPQHRTLKSCCHMLVHTSGMFLSPSPGQSRSTFLFVCFKTWIISIVFSLVNYEGIQPKTKHL